MKICFLSIIEKGFGNWESLLYIYTLCKKIISKAWKKQGWIEFTSNGTFVARKRCCKCIVQSQTLRVFFMFLKETNVPLETLSNFFVWRVQLSEERLEIIWFTCKWRLQIQDSNWGL